MKNNLIHPTAIIGENVTLGENNYIGPYCYITGDTIIGDNNRFEAYCSIGTSPEHRDYFTNSAFNVIIGNNNIVREFVTINAGTIRNTILKNNTIILRNSHIGHDSIIENKVNLSCNVLIGGHSYIMEGVNMGLGSICHQFKIIGAYSMIGMGTIVTKNSKIEPGNIYIGSPSRFLKENTIGLERNNINKEYLNNLIIKFNFLTDENKL
jgi:UDP-N-acetylglucosamine acyltransferase